ncbi:MAG: ATP-binding protein [Lachnospiraceae bacterium]
MRLVSCYIENFGVLHKFEHTFTLGLNVIQGENGWGKSTLSAFIRAMLYGLDDSKKRDLDARLRKKYEPWQGGKFGGSLTIEMQGHRLRIERFFAARSTDDEFCLYDEATGMKSTLFTSQIGEELFKIDAQAYERTTSIPQESIRMQANDSINARLGKLEKSENDMADFEKAVKRLAQASKEYVKTKDRGRLGENRLEQAALEEELRGSLAKKRALEEYTKLAADLKQETEALKEQHQVAKYAIEKAGAYQRDAARIQQYRELVEDEKAQSEQLRPLLRVFNGTVPTDELMQYLEEMKAQLLTLRGKWAGSKLSDQEVRALDDLDRFFYNGVPSPEALDEINRLLDEYQKSGIPSSVNPLPQEEQQKKEQLEEKFAKMPLEQEELAEVKEDIEDWSRIQKQKGELLARLEATERKSRYDSSRRNMERNRMVGLTLLFVGVLAALVSFAAIFRMVDKTLPIVGFLVVLLLIGFAERFYRKYSLHKRIFLLEQQADEIREYIERYLAAYGIEAQDSTEVQFYAAVNQIEREDSELKYLKRHTSYSWQEESEERQLSPENEIQEWFTAYTFNKPYTFEETRSFIRTVEKNRQMYEDLHNKAESNQKIKASTEESVQQLKKKMGSYYLPETSLLKKIEILRETYDEYKMRIAFVNDIRQKLEAFDKENLMFPDADEFFHEESLSELQRNEYKVQQEIIRNSERLHDTEFKIKGLRTEIAEFEQMEARLRELQEEFLQGKAQYKTIVRTLEYLTEAKNQFASKYLAATRKSFTKYVKMLTDGRIKEVDLDINLEITVTQRGQRRELAYFSTGYKDLLGFCLRLAVVDAMFEEEMPFLILDDTFVNLDEEKLEVALKLLKKISGRYQILYLICHKDRGVQSA